MYDKVTAEMCVTLIELKRLTHWFHDKVTLLMSKGLGVKVEAPSKDNCMPHPNRSLLCLIWFLHIFFYI